MGPKETATDPLPVPGQTLKDHVIISQHLVDFIGKGSHDFLKKAAPSIFPAQPWNSMYANLETRSMARNMINCH
jgi:hypothetical protein